MTIIEHPDPVLKAKWGPLSHVSAEERKRILELPFGKFKPTVAMIESELKDLKKKNKKKSKDNSYQQVHRKPPNLQFGD